MPASPPSARSEVATTGDNYLLCAHCGYDLRTLPAGGACPECAFPIAESLCAPIRGPSSLPGVQRAMKLWCVACLLCIGVALLLWLYLRFWPPLGQDYPRLLDRSFGGAVWSGLVFLEHLGGLLKIASVVILLRAIRSPRTNIVVVGCYMLLALTALDILALALAPRMQGLLPLPLLTAHWPFYIACAPLVVWLSALVAFLRVTRATRADTAPRLKRAARVGAAAITILLLSSVAYVAIATIFPWWWWRDNPIWASRFPTWSGNGAIEKIAEAILLASVIPWIRLDLRSRN